MLFRRISLQLMTGFCIFGEKMVCLEIVLKTKYIFLALSMWECSSEVEHSTADREVGWFNSVRSLLHYSGLLVERL